MTAVDELPLRERKKAITRQAILDAAERLFEERGYDNVTTAEIANEANISEKTLFVYFRSKQELAFADTWLIDRILEALRNRGAGGPAHAVADVLISAAKEQRDDLGVEGFYRGYGQSAALESALLRFWASYEDRITAQLAAESTTDATPAHRLLAIQLVGIPRMATSREVRDTLDGLSAEQSTKRLKALLRAAADSIDAGQRG